MRSQRVRTRFFRKDYCAFNARLAEKQTVSCQTFFFHLLRLNQDERASGAVSVGDDPACLLSALAAASHQDMSAGVIIQEWVFFGGNNCSQAGGTIRRRGGKTAIDAFLLPPPPKNPSAIVVPANKLSGEQKVLGVR